MKSRLKSVCEGRQPARELGGESAQANALLYGDPYDFNSLNQPTSVAEYLRAF